MDSVIVLFASASFEDVEAEARSHGFANGSVVRGDCYFYLWRYSAESMRAEFEPQELETVHRVLGTVSSAFQVACRHGGNARFALEVVGSLMSRFQPSLLDDDFGGLWSAGQVMAHAKSGPVEGIYAVRTAA